MPEAAAIQMVSIHILTVKPTYLVSSDEPFDSRLFE